MSDPKHTPGPWFVGHFARPDHSCNCRYIFGNDDRMGAVCEVYVEECKNDNPPRDEAIANMHLIAAGPDMLAALKTFNLKEEQIVSGSADSITIRVPIAVIQQAADAIAKAEGRP